MFDCQRLPFSFLFFIFFFSFDVSQHKLKHIRLSAQSAATSHARRERHKKGERETRETREEDKGIRKPDRLRELPYQKRLLPVDASHWWPTFFFVPSSVEHSIDDFIVQRRRRNKKGEQQQQQKITWPLLCARFLVKFFPFFFHVYSLL